MARKLILFIAASLDGYIAKEGDDLEWLLHTDGEGDNGYMEMYERIDTLIMGKRTYDYVMEHTDSFPYPDKTCYVYSNSEKGTTEHVAFVNEDVVSFTHKLQQEEGSNIWVAGGAAILDAFMKARLIDEYIITITPHILGSGVPLFLVNNPEIHLVLKETKRYGQFVQMHYEAK